MNKSFQNWLIIFGIIVVSGIIFYFALPKRDNDVDDVMGVKSESLRNAPYITSIAPLSLSIGEYLEYEIRVSDLDSTEDEIVYILEEAPDWMYISNGIVLGSPSESGTYKFVVSVSDGQNSTSQINYIVVEE